MRIQELYLKNFGKFHQKRFLIEDGVQVFYGENEYGKSTIYAFIKAMLFGMERGRGRASCHDEYSKYEPWDNPNYYAGVMRFTCGGKRFYLERNFDRYQRNAYLVCEDDGEELSVEDGDLTELLDGMTLSDFENTVAVGQLSVESGQSLVSALHNYAANYSATMDSDLNLQQALERLKAAKKEAVNQRRELAGVRRERQERLRNHQEYLQQEMKRLKEEILELQEEFSEQKVIEKESQKQKSLDRKRKFPKVMIILITLLLVVFASLRLLDTDYVGAGILLVIALVFVSGILVRRRGDWRMKREERAKDLEALGTRLEVIEWRLSHLREEFQEKKTQHQNLEEDVQELEELSAKELELLRRTEAFALAAETMQRLARETSANFERQFNQNASHILSAITDGAYSRLILDADGELYLYEAAQNLRDARLESPDVSRRISVRQVSKGTAQQVWFAFRMAAAQVLSPADFPLILDETFAFYDDRRLKSTLKWLSEQPRQVIIFTCQKREREALKAL